MKILKCFSAGKLIKKIKFDKIYHQEGQYIEIALEREDERRVIFAWSGDYSIDFEN